MKSIKKQIALCIVAIVTVTAVCLGTVGIITNTMSTMSSLEKTMTLTAAVAGQNVDSRLGEYRSVVEDIGLIARLSNTESTSEAKRAILQERVTAERMHRLGIADMSGSLLMNDGSSLPSISGQSYFTTASKGNCVITDPIASGDTFDIIVAAPLWQNGKPNSTVVGVIVAYFDINILTEVTNSINIGDTGSTYMVDSTGATIAHNNVELVKARDNDIENAKTNPKLKKLGAITQRMTSGENGFDEYTYNGVTKIMSFSPVPNTPGWCIAVTAEKNEFTQIMIIAMIVIFAAAILFCIIGVILGSGMGSKIANPIIKVVERLNLLSSGDLTTPVAETTAKNETRTLTDSLTLTITNLKDVVYQFTTALECMSRKDLNIHFDKEYHGDFYPMGKSLQKIISSFNDVMSELETAAQQVSSGSEQVSSGAQALSQGTTEQASAVEELAASVGDISTKVRQNAESAATANETVHLVSSELNESNRKMQTMIAAITDISDASSEIGKIIKTIDDIAFQTNILALNAAVEAARAGAAGKGFAVVAEEVRNLAGKSAEAAKNTTGLIETTVAAVKNGTEIAHETASSMIAVVDGAMKVESLIASISDSSVEQANAINQVTQGLDQVSAVVQTNSATAEESAAASEQLSSQAEMLSQMVGEFKLKD